jgi:hypothetical protein
MVRWRVRERLARTHVTRARMTRAILTTTATAGQPSAAVATAVPTAAPTPAAPATRIAFTPTCNAALVPRKSRTEFPGPVQEPEDVGQLPAPGREAISCHERTHPVCATWMPAGGDEACDTRNPPDQ